MNALRPALAVSLLVSVALAGCAAAAPPSAPPTSPPSAAAPTDPPPTQVPGGANGSPGSGVVGGGGGGVDPGLGQPRLSIPKPGTTLDAHPVSIETLEPQIDGRTVVILATWTSGVEPCYVLDTVSVEQEGNAFTVSLTEGHAPGDNMCIEIAEQHATAIALGELEPGTYKVAAAEGPAAEITFTID